MWAIILSLLTEKLRLSKDSTPTLPTP